MSLEYLEDMLRQHHVPHHRQQDGTIVWPYESRYVPRCHPIVVSEGERGYIYARVFFPCRIPPSVDALCAEICEWFSGGISIGYPDARNGFYMQAYFQPDYTEAGVYELVEACDHFLPLYDLLVDGGSWTKEHVFLAFVDEDSFNNA